MEDFSKREFTEFLASVQDEQLELMAEAIVSTQKKRHTWRRWIQPDRIWLVLLTALWIYPWIVGISADGDLALVRAHFDVVLNMAVTDQEIFLACMDQEFLVGVEDVELGTLLVFFGLLIAWAIFFVWVPVQWFYLALRMFFQRYRIRIHDRER